MSNKYMKKGSSSDYIDIKKQNAIYKELSQNATNLGTINPVKTNGQTYNNKLTILKKNTQKCCNSRGKNIKYVNSYGLQMNYYKGRDYKNYKCAIPTNEGGDYTKEGGCFELCMCFEE